MGLTALSIFAMMWLARAKRRAAAELGSRALESDAFQTTACFWLSVITLGGLALNALLGWWWADPVAALGMTWFIGREGAEAWKGEECGCNAGVPAGADWVSGRTGACGGAGRGACGCPEERDR